MRFDISIKMEQTFVFAVEARSAPEAQATAIALMAEKDPERMELTIDVERGNG